MNDGMWLQAAVETVPNAYAELLLLDVPLEFKGTRVYHCGHMILLDSAAKLVEALRNDAPPIQGTRVIWSGDPTPFLGHESFNYAHVAVHKGRLVFTLVFPMHIKHWSKSKAAQKRWAEERVNHLRSWGITGTIVQP